MGRSEQGVAYMRVSLGPELHVRRARHKIDIPSVPHPSPDNQRVCQDCLPCLKEGVVIIPALAREQELEGASS